MHKLVVLVSGGGGNLQAIIAALAAQKITNSTISAVIADRDCLALTRAQAAGIPTHLLARKEYGTGLSAEIAKLVPHDCDLIILAGYLSILSPDFIAQFAGRIINLHPALLPKYGGAGMWGIKVHQAVVAAGEHESGCTIHYVDSGIDSGAIIAQSRLSLNPGESATSLQARIIPLEHQLLVDVIIKLLAEQV